MSDARESYDLETASRDDRKIHGMRERHTEGNVEMNNYGVDPNFSKL